MNPASDSVQALVEHLKRKAPEYLDLISAKTDDEFEAAFDALLEKAISHVEANSKNFRQLDEEGLSAALALGLSMPGLTVTQETNSNGHVDLTIEADHCSPQRKKLGEAKIYNGPAYHVSGLKQLLRRYVTGRESHGLLIAYVRKSNIKKIFVDLRAQLDADLPEHQTGMAKDHSHKWSFVTQHQHHSGEDVPIVHVGCNLFVSK
jgi:hypothetical protein